MKKTYHRGIMRDQCSRLTEEAETKQKQRSQSWRANGMRRGMEIEHSKPEIEKKRPEQYRI